MKTGSYSEKKPYSSGWNRKGQKLNEKKGGGKEGPGFTKGGKIKSAVVRAQINKEEWTAVFLAHLPEKKRGTKPSASNM